MEESTRIDNGTVDESNTPRSPTLIRRLHYWWSLSVAGALLLFLAPPILIVAWLVNKHDLVYPVASFGAAAWLRLSGVRVRVHGLELLDPKQTYIFVSNHRSYLDTATVFVHVGRRIGLLAKKELLKVPILGVGGSFIKIMAIDRTNRESAMRTADAAVRRIQSGVSFAIFVEGTRAKPGELLPFKKGAFYMAKQAGVPVVPIAIRNSDVLMGKGTGAAKGGVIDMVIMPPVSTADVESDQDIAELISTVRTSIANELQVSAG